MYNTKRPMLDDSGKEATPFDYGGGHIRPNRAMDTGTKVIHQDIFQCFPGLIWIIAVFVLGSCGNYQVGVAEMETVFGRTGGHVALAVSFGHVFKDSSRHVFEDREQSLRLSALLQWHIRDQFVEKIQRFSG